MSGRKRRERTETVRARIPVSLVRKLDSLAVETVSTRSAALRLLLQRGFTTIPKRYLMEG